MEIVLRSSVEICCVLIQRSFDWKFIHYQQHWTECALATVPSKWQRRKNCGRERNHQLLLHFSSNRSTQSSQGQEKKIKMALLQATEKHTPYLFNVKVTTDINCFPIQWDATNWESIYISFQISLEGHKLPCIDVALIRFNWNRL